jgi:hypothetical protein
MQDGGDKVVDESALAKAIANLHRFNGGNKIPSDSISRDSTIRYKFETAFHPHVSRLIRGLDIEGVPGLLNLSNETIGNPYLHSPWKVGNVISTSSTNSACVIESAFGMTIIARPPSYTPNPGNFEAVVLEGNILWHYWRDGRDSTKPWIRAQLVTDHATGPGCITERISQREYQPPRDRILPGDWDVVVLQGNELHHYTLDTSATNPPFVHRGIVTSQATGPGCIIESDSDGNRYIPPISPKLETVVLESNRLVHYQYDNANNRWLMQGIITERATGPGCIIQSSLGFGSGGRLGNFEVVVLEGHELVHYSKDHGQNIWQRVSVITDAANSPGWITQSRIRDGPHGNFEVVVNEGNQLVHYWKDNSDPGSRWRRGLVISTKTSAQGCIIGRSYILNFEVVVHEKNGSLVHYWNVNEGKVGSESERFYFAEKYWPSNRGQHFNFPYPRNDIDFSYRGSYSLYNWEIFFHVPMLLAAQLSKNQRFGDAMRWYHYILDPTDESEEVTTHRYWKFLPFRDVEKQRIDHMLEILGDPSKIGSVERQEIEDQLDDWGKHPFQPHRIARLRLIAYQKNVVMKYIDNLVAWGDQLFRRDTIESINEATQLYILAANILGPKPQHGAKKKKTNPQTYAELRKKLDEFRNAREAIENEFPSSSSMSSIRVTDESIGLLGVGDFSFFCIPQNDKLLGYWDTVADRLFKIRNCMNMEGVVRQLPLFEPPIDPALLVRAAAGGVDIGSVLSDLSTPLPSYRFTYMMQKALDICSQLQSFGTALLSALEKRDGEALAYLRTKHEKEILKMIRSVKEQQYNEADASRIALESSRNLVVSKYLHYQTLLGVENPQKPKRDDEIQDYVPSGNYKLESGEEGVKLTTKEKSELDLAGEASEYQNTSAWSETAASIAHAIPTQTADGHPYGVGTDVIWGGSSLGSAASAVAAYYGRKAGNKAAESSKASKIGSLALREREWTLQNNQAAREIMQIDKQLTAAEIRVAITQLELDNHDKQIEQTQFIEDFLHDKYTNKDLYSWMQGEISAIYFQCYQLAYDLAKRAERCYRHELGITNSNFIQFGYWDSLRKGLLSGERLQLSLKQMERAYDDQHKREYEITKNISLVMNLPQELIKLKQTGQCIIELPEALFDADYPGHFMRRIKSASLTIPCVVGPYASINCTLTLLASKTRISNNAQGDYPEQIGEDSRFVYNFAALQSVTTSHAQNDSGMFELNFRDERYLPFEGSGVISRWRIDMPIENNAFDFSTISDVILKLNYTSRDGGEMLRQKARDAIVEPPQEDIVRMFSLKHEFSNPWNSFLHPTDLNATEQILNLELTKERFPFRLLGKTITINKVGLFMSFKEEKYYKDYSEKEPLSFSLTLTDTLKKGSLKSDPSLNNMPTAILDDFGSKVPGSITVTVTEEAIKLISSSLQQSTGPDGHVRLNVDALGDLFIVCWYSAEEEA